MDTRIEFPQTAIAAIGRAKPSARRWAGDRDTAIFTLALLPPLTVSFYESGAGLLPVLAGALFVAIGWTLLFSLFRGRDMSWHIVPVAVVFSLLLPPSVPLWQALLALSFGVVMGEQIFGGRGYAFLHPAVVALAFLFFSFPGIAMGPANASFVALAALPGAALLLATGRISWRILLMAALIPAAWTMIGEGGTPAALLTVSFAIGIVYLVGEPTSAAVTNPGRWAYGLLAGVLMVLLGEAGDGIGSTGTVVFTALLASTFAPLIDRIVIFANVRRRRRRQWPISTR